MKNNFLKPILFSVLTAGIMASCVNDDDYSVINNNCVETTLTANLPVADIPAGSQVAQITQDYIVEAYVTSSDRSGNFFKSISFQTLDGSRGFSVPVDVTSTFINFEPGRKVFIKLNGLYTDTSNGVRIGDIYLDGGQAQVGRLPEAKYRSVLQRSCNSVPENQLVRVLTIPELLNDANLNTLVELQNVQFDDTAIQTTYYDAGNDLGGATNHNLVDAQGRSVIFRTSSFADFAPKNVPSGSGKVRGVLTKFGTTYQFIARYESDVMLTEPRRQSIFSQNFESITSTGNNQFINLPGWTNVSMNNGTERWEARIFSNNKYAQMSAFQTNENNVDTRLITPAINLDNSTNETLTFGYKTGFANGTALTVWYSTNYNGAGSVAAVNAATWTQLPVTLNVQDTSFASDFYAVTADLSGINGNVYISFRYQGSSSGVTTTYQVDNIKVIGQN
ncbi:hypothetical protein CHU92_02260 [Flavobacterium cyanobacteriorum]|uniref:DUF5689 domain-containing protein n=1 Tax=Flavobacterium cyanobacteriorum TaxID=2022802 RepID=A0A255ZU10_9FLAO|nr:DUF5689 domain-containing protein [Flavobacterium cyanobacteriorum]OYQ44879.1 hypothetical protein CHU92_02260 [Flavobacterium cyanobacteriorum]